MQVWFTAVIAGIAALIAYMQWVTAHQKVVLDLFDRRKKAFEELEKAVAPIFSTGDVSDEAFNDLIRAKASCRFLFGADVNDFVQSMQSDFAFMKTYTDAVINQREGAERGRLIDKKYEALNRIVDFHNVAIPLFAPYIHLDLKMRYFPLVDLMPSEWASHARTSLAPRVDRIRSAAAERLTKLKDRFKTWR